jgi:hypothetical protein
MPNVAFLVVGSPNAGFYSQVAAINLAIKTLPWRRWRPEIFVAMGGPSGNGEDSFERWRAHLREVSFSYVAETAWEQANNWAQVETRLLSAPRNMDIYVTIDADTLPVAPLEDVLDEIHATQSIAGVMAHFPPPGLPDSQAWHDLATRIGAPRLEFLFDYSLMDKADPENRHRAPIYFNGGVVFFANSCFERFVKPYFTNIWQLIEALPEPSDDFSGQIALPFTVEKTGLVANTLPMRYNYPNDDLAISLNPGELEEVIIFHYLRTHDFDRRKIFADAVEYRNFLDMPLTGVNLAFQAAVRRLFGQTYPFG